MSSNVSPLVILIATVAAVAVYSIVFYGAYWAFTIRKALAGRLYRRQALWLDVFAAYFLTLPLVILLLNPNFPFGGDPTVNFFGGALYYLGYVVVFAWVDATIRVARLSDPLLRDTLHWKRLRNIVWALVALGTAEILGRSLSVILTQTFPSVGENLLLLVAILAIVSSGAPALVLSGLRSKDTTLRRHLRWFGLFVGVFITTNTTGFALITFGLASVTQPYLAVVFPISVVAAYSFYRSARSLAPIGRLDRSASVSSRQSRLNPLSTSEATSSPPS